jgi:hypothetical protein
VKAHPEKPDLFAVFIDYKPLSDDALLSLGWNIKER